MRNKSAWATHKSSFIKYVIAGGLASVVEYGSFYLLFVYAGMLLVLANAISFCLGLTAAFFA